MCRVLIVGSVVVLVMVTRSDKSGDAPLRHVALRPHDARGAQIKAQKIANARAMMQIFGRPFKHLF